MTSDRNKGWRKWAADCVAKRCSFDRPYLKMEIYIFSWRRLAMYTTIINE